jgi:lipopolysaccharide biosynthesis protein
MALTLKMMRFAKTVIDTPARLLQHTRDVAEINAVRKRKVLGIRTCEYAVVIHLYHLERWPLFHEALLRLRENGCEYDLFITLPPTNIHFTDTIKQSFSEARVVQLRNHGRDVRPFMIVATLLKEMGYTATLKLHSKKSTHRSDGKEWLEGMVRDLVPQSITIQRRLEELLHSKKTGVIGPSDVYYPLSVNFPANGVHMSRVCNKIFSKKVSYEVLQKNRKAYGFFAGTMFWVRLDAIDQLFAPRFWRFEKEAGQIDGTFAHALERLYCVVPEVAGRALYEVGSKGVVRRSYESSHIPDWSEDHNK